MSFSFGDLSLSGVTAAAGVSVLAPGKYICKVADVEIADTKAKTGKVLKVKLRCDAGVITDNLNVQNQSGEAQRIGLEQLKALLVHGGHQDPDNIGQHGLQSIKGLTVGVLVGAEMYNGSPSSKVRGYFSPDAGSALSSPLAAPSAKVGSDDIPF